MKWFKKKTKPEQPTSPPQIMLQGQHAGLASLASDYYSSLPVKERVRLPIIFLDVTGKDTSGLTINQVVQSLSKEELVLVQQLIEKEYKITKH